NLQSSSLHWSVSSSNVVAYASFGEEGTEAMALLNNNPYNNWVGIGCNNVGRVTSMNFTSYGLRGTLHNFNFSFFPSLLRMDFRNNSLLGIIPPHFSNLSKLIFLDLSLNHLSETIPFEICLLSDLNFFDMSLNQISGSIPQQIGMLSSLNGLSLHSNYLTGSISASIGNLSGLSTRLFRNSNKLSGHIPSNIGNLRKLQMLSLFQNQLTGTILPELNNLTFFVVFAVSQNELIGQLPRDICFSVRLERNELTGNLSEDFGSYPTLNYIDLSYNKFYGQLLEKWGEPCDLTSFRISNINISGGIPPKLAKATHLCSSSQSKPTNRCGSTKTCSIEKLRNFHNELHGSIQSTLDGMLSLALVDIFYNQLEGPLPNIKAFQVPFEALRGNTVGMKEMELKGANNQNLFSIWSYDGKLGGFGVVYEAHLLSGQVVTVKKFEVSQVGELAHLKSFATMRMWILNGLRGSMLLKVWQMVCLISTMNNVLLDGEYVAHISDFGTARFLKPDSYYWTSFAGTIGYAAPGIYFLL
ncbi:putative leucine-rich repeat receptor-like protein kinase, partial [Camellia lanceoleosa]